MSPASVVAFIVAVGGDFGVCVFSRGWLWFCCSRWWIFGGICVDLCFELGEGLLQ